MVQLNYHFFVVAAEIMLSDMKEMPALRFGDVELKLELEELTPEQKEVARMELRETPDLSRESLEELRALLKEDNELTLPIDNDHFLIRFLRPCKFYPKSAYELVSKCCRLWYSTKRINNSSNI